MLGWKLNSVVAKIFGSPSAFPPSIVSASKIPYFAHVSTSKTKTSAIQKAKETFWSEPFVVPPGSMLETVLNHGKTYEPVALDMMREYPGFKNGGYKKSGLMTDKQITFFANFQTKTEKHTEDFTIQATPDSIWVLKNLTGYPMIPIEVKCPYVENQGSLKLEWWLQCQVQILVLSAPYGLVGVYNHPGRITVYEVQPDPEVSKFILEVASDAYTKGFVMQTTGNANIFRAKAGVPSQNRKFAVNKLLSTTFYVTADGERRPYSLRPEPVAEDSDYFQ